MARHWSTFVNITDKQARALDKMAQAHGMHDGMDLLMEISGRSRSKIGKADRVTVNSWVDEAFENYSDR